MAVRAGGAPPLTSAEQALTDLLTPALAADGVVVEEVRVLAGGQRRVVKVLVDRDPYAEERAPDVPIPGLSLDEVADVSRAVGDQLDALGADQDPLEGRPYTLEVSSPGVDRPLVLPRHFRRNVGRLVDLDTVERGRLRGRIAAVTADSVALSDAKGTQELTWPEVRSAVVQVEFRRPDDSGGGSGDEES